MISIMIITIFNHFIKSLVLKCSIMEFTLYVSGFPLEFKLLENSVFIFKSLIIHWSCVFVSLSDAHPGLEFLLPFLASDVHHDGL